MSQFTEEEIAATMGAYTSARQIEEDEWHVYLDVENQHFLVNGYSEDLEHANWFRRQVALALLTFNAKMNKQNICVKCRSKRRADW